MKFATFIGEKNKNNPERYLTIFAKKNSKKFDYSMDNLKEPNFQQ